MLAMAPQTESALSDITGALDASIIRALAGTTGFILLTFWLKRWGNAGRACLKPVPMIITATGAFAGPFLGVALLMVSIQTISTGVAQTIVALVPVLILPIVIFVEKERVSGRAAIGAVIAVAGVGLLFYRQ